MNMNALLSLATTVNNLLSAAKALRQAQRDYMADRGNETLGRIVGIRAEELDVEIEATERWVEVNFKRVMHNGEQDD